jgi:hypothetical protein
MALCPDCHAQKPFFAPRCGTCNQIIGFKTQLWTMTLYYGVQVLVLAILAVWLLT